MAILKNFQVFKKSFRFSRANAFSRRLRTEKQGSFRCPAAYDISIHLTLLSSLAKVMLKTRPPGVRILSA